MCVEQCTDCCEGRTAAPGRTHKTTAATMLGRRLFVGVLSLATSVMVAGYDDRCDGASQDGGEVPDAACGMEGAFGI